MKIMSKFLLWIFNFDFFSLIFIFLYYFIALYSVPSDKNVQKRNNLAQELENEKAEMLSKGLNPYVEFRRREIENEVFLLTYCFLILLDWFLLHVFISWFQGGHHFNFCMSSPSFWWHYYHCYFYYYFVIIAVIIIIISVFFLIAVSIISKVINLIMILMIMSVTVLIITIIIIDTAIRIKTEIIIIIITAITK